MDWEKSSRWGNSLGRLRLSPLVGIVSDGRIFLNSATLPIFVKRGNVHTLGDHSQEVAKLVKVLTKRSIGFNHTHLWARHYSTT